MIANGRAEPRTHSGSALAPIAAGDTVNSSNNKLQRHGIDGNNCDVLGRRLAEKVAASRLAKKTTVKNRYNMATFQGGEKGLITIFTA